MGLSSKAGCSGAANNTSPVTAMRDNRGATHYRVAPSSLETLKVVRYCDYALLIKLSVLL